MRTKLLLFLLMICLLFAGCAAKVTPLTTPRVEASGLSFQLPEGWAYEAYKWQPDDERETVVSVFPSDDKPVAWMMGPFLWNVSLYAAGEGEVGLNGIHNYEEGMTVDEWAEARRAWQERMENQPLQDYTVEEISEDTRKVQYTPVGEGLPDTILIYLRVIDGHALWLGDGRPIEGGATEEDMALFEQIILSVEVPAMPRVEAAGLSF